MFKDIEGGSDHDLVDSTAFAATSDRHKVSPIVSRTLQASGMLDVDPTTGATVQNDTIRTLAANTGGANCAIWCIRDTTLGDPSLIICGSLPKPTVKSVLADVVATMFGAQSNQSGWGRALKPKGTASGAVNGTALDNAALTSNGGLSALQVFALTGTAPVIRVKVQHSVDGSTWVDLATHTDINAAGVTAGYAETQPVAGTVNRYLRYALTVVSGSLTSITFANQFARY
jgi:hypothetical protein